MQNRIIKQSDAEYFADPALDQTMLKKFMQSPKAYASAVTHPMEPTKAMLFGRLAHAKVLGDGADYQVKPNLRTKAGKEEYEEGLKNGVCFASEEDIVTAEAMAAETRPYFEALGGQPEMAMYSTDAWTRLDLKGKADWLPDKVDSDGVYRIRDYKTTSGDLDDFGREAAKLGYHIQAAYYIKLYSTVKGLVFGDMTVGFEFVVQQKQAPYDYAIYRLDSGDMEINLAQRHIEQSLNDFARYQRNSDNPLEAMSRVGVSKEPRPLEFPLWALEQEEALLYA